MEVVNYDIYSGLFFFQDIPSNPNITTFDVVLSFLFGVFLITAMTLTLEQWRREQIKDLEEERRLLNDRLLKMGIAIETILI